MPDKSCKGNIHLALILLISFLIALFFVYKNYSSDFIATAGKPGVSVPSPTPASVCNMPLIPEFNKAAVLTGTGVNDKLILIKQPTAINLSGDFTIEAWIKLNDIQTINSEGRKTIFGRASTGNTAGVSLSMERIDITSLIIPRLKLTVASLPYNQNYIGETIYGTSPILPNMWYHVAAVKNGSNLSLFINGKKEKLLDNGQSSQDGVYTGQLLDSGDSPISIGGLYFDGAIKEENNIEGAIEEVRISNSARYSANFTVSVNPFTTDVNTMALFHLDENTIDSTGSNTGEILGDVIFSDSSLQYSPDSDFDGWSDCSESKIGTNFSKACPMNIKDVVWVPDFNNDKKVDSNDRRIIDNAFDPKTYLNAKYNKRYDLNTDGKLDTKDRNLIEFFINQSCN
ncbi:hypothetical protein A3F00_02785 [Candidatus Daviesbacteria bacterium RIFCSPHIGHO2_12_FULL_37_11]|uniref:Dockerin domain-containing protein n=1 Tax=Candidatus Daviesbacteria bacterium RIFCSPHIGHO2_12_FULL_37_11 TaxID=1797777 RepID=A0A1F5K8X8_9BACT|nr:MAG: hypothetical protein A2769_01910 [Candidatus Daviesbacteria bacterium RIFCSPHIGHO2_01_FULL_37_27]OGE37377.1 MAG: hypothetical protein A3F00_02785 [Candidatus Daviesbacteria bacterium RIFCSPHIGHO2_12_FULL_37_11]OGE45543.1 MAG: hypothetical protein A3B39_05020 [Candidatus Daviesbacteria bacterium RIFCSPLOWO2_01_FULL_37_10]